MLNHSLPNSPIDQMAYVVRTRKHSNKKTALHYCMVPPLPLPPPLPPSGRVTDVTRDSSVKVTRPTATSTTAVTRQHLSEFMTVLTLPRGSVFYSLFTSASLPMGDDLDRSANRGRDGRENPTWGILTLELTSSNLAHMSLKAVKMESVLPVTVTILSGHEPSLMLIFAPD